MKIQEIKGEVKIAGAVETFTGNAEKELWLKNAETFFKVGEIKKALDLYEEIQNKYPDEPRGCLGTLEIIVNKGYEVAELLKMYSTYKLIAQFERIYNIYSSVAEEVKDKQYFMDIFTSNFLNGAIKYGEVPEFFLPKNITEEGYQNILLYEQVYYKDDCDGAYKRNVRTQTQNAISFADLQNMKANIISYRRNNGLRLFCGGNFKGFIYVGS